MAEVEFRILGPMEVGVAGEAVPLAGPKQRAVLALLVLHANEVVPRDRLIDDLWGDEPPAEAAATLRVYVARLRKILSVANGAAPTLEAFRNGYVLRVAPERIDLNRFKALVAAGEEALAAGRAGDASKRLGDALALWRGPALADLADEPGVLRETRRLEELRLHALEKRIDADLAVGHHAELVAELEALVAAQPYRERFAAQLMVALYRCGRQPDALRMYGQLRTALHDDFALEPTQTVRNLERQILAQDPALDLPTSVRDATGGPAARGRRRFGSRALVAVAAALVVLLAAGLLAFERDPAVPSAQPVALRGNSVVAIDQLTGAVLGETRIGGRPSGLAAGFGSVWVGNLDDRTLLRIDARTRRIVDTIGLGTGPTTMAVGGGSVWIVSHAANAVLQVDPAVNDVVATVDLPRVESFVGEMKIAFARGYVWVKSRPSGLLTRIDPQTHVSAVVARDVVTVASSGRALWAIVGSDDYRLRRFDPPGEAIRLERLGAIYAPFGWLGAGYGVVWTASPDGTLWRIDADTSRITASVPLRRRIGGIALAPRAAWIVTTGGDVVRVDANEARVTNTIALGVYPPQLVGAIAAAEGIVWVAALE
jgi:DNA-binding SARP family transcriptional activator/streptogramin lyase